MVTDRLRCFRHCWHGSGVRPSGHYCTREGAPAPTCPKPKAERLGLQAPIAIPRRTLRFPTTAKIHTGKANRRIQLLHSCCTRASLVDDDAVDIVRRAEVDLKPLYGARVGAGAASVHGSVDGEPPPEPDD